MAPKPLTSEELAELSSGLNRLARNLWWTWDEGAQEIFQELSPRGWQTLYHNAVAFRPEVSGQALRVRFEEPLLGQKERRTVRAFNRSLSVRPTRGVWRAAPPQPSP